MDFGECFLGLPRGMVMGYKGLHFLRSGCFGHSVLFWPLNYNLSKCHERCTWTDGYFSNMTPNLTKYPNHKAKFIIVDSDSNLYEYSKLHKIDNSKEARKDETLYYYLKIPKLKDEKNTSNFLKNLLKKILIKTSLIEIQLA